MNIIQIKKYNAVKNNVTSQNRLKIIDYFLRQAKTKVS